jgi:hypothetical protein
VAKCAHCRREFTPRKVGHRFCTVRCRHRGERQPDAPAPPSQGLIDRLFDPRQAPEQPVRDDDWLPESCVVMKGLYMCDTVEGRRRWYQALRRLGRV